MKIRTFNEWSEAGYRINKGSKQLGKNIHGQSLFAENQVTATYIPKRTRTYSTGDEGPDEDSMYWGGMDQVEALQ